MNCRVVCQSRARDRYAACGESETFAWCETHRQEVTGMTGRCPIGEVEAAVRRGMQQLRRQLKRGRQ